MQSDVWNGTKCAEYLLLTIMSRFDEAFKPYSDRARAGSFAVRRLMGSRQSRERNHCVRPDLFVMDVSMPDMNGLEATRIILHERPETRVLILSHNDRAIVRRQAIEARAHGFVEKSNIQRDLISAVEGILWTMADQKKKRQVKSQPATEQADLAPRWAGLCATSCRVSALARSSKP